MKTNLEIDDKLMRQALDLSGVESEQEAIEAALKHWVYFLAVRKLDAVRGPDLWQGDLEQMRTGSPLPK